MHDEHELSPLIIRALSGEESAINAMLGKIRPYLHLLSRQQVNLVPGANLEYSDIVQETLMRVHQGFLAGAARFQGTSPPQFLAWIRQIQQHVIQDLERRGRARKRDGSRLQSISSFVVAGNALPGDAMQTLERATRLAVALESLPENYRDIVQMRIFDQMPYLEISRQTGKTDAALRVTFVRAIAALRQHPQLRFLQEDST